MKNPLCRTGNVSLSGQIDAENWGQVDDECCHSRTADSLECALVYFSASGQVFREWGACAEAMETLQDAPEGSGNSQPCCRSLTRPQNEILEHRIDNGSVLQFGCSPRDALWRIIVVNKRRKMYHSDLQITRRTLCNPQTCTRRRNLA